MEMRRYVRHSPAWWIVGGILALLTAGCIVHGQRVGVQHIERLATGHFPDGVLIQRRQLCPQKLLAMSSLTPMQYLFSIDGT